MSVVLVFWWFVEAAGAVSDFPKMILNFSGFRRCPAGLPDSNVSSGGRFLAAWHKIGFRFT
jgi:hypothetical protein